MTIKKAGLILLLILVALIPSSIAKAHHVTIDGYAECVQGGQYRIVWTIWNSESQSNRVMRVTGINRAVNGLHVGLNVPANGSSSGDEYLPGNTSGEIRLEVSVIWDYRSPPVTDSRSKKVYLNGSCQPPTSTPTKTPTKTHTPTYTNTATSTSTNTKTPTHTPTYTHTNTNTPTHTNTSTSTYTPDYTPTHTPTHTNTPTNTPTDTPTNTPTHTHTSTFTPTWTNTHTNTPTRTPSRTPVNTLTNTPQIVKTPETTPFVPFSLPTPTVTPICYDCPLEENEECFVDGYNGIVSRYYDFDFKGYRYLVVLQDDLVDIDESNSDLFSYNSLAGEVSIVQELTFVEALGYERDYGPLVWYESCSIKCEWGVMQDEENDGYKYVYMKGATVFTLAELIRDTEEISMADALEYSRAISREYHREMRSGSEYSFGFYEISR